jgi:hypothetical protein
MNFGGLRPIRRRKIAKDEAESGQFRLYLNRAWSFYTASVNLRRERFVRTGPLNSNLPPLLTHPKAAAVRHKRSIVVSMAEGTFCTGHAEIRLIQIRIQAAFRGD